MEGSLQRDFFHVGARVTSATALAVFLLLGLPLLVSAAERGVVINEVMWDEVEYIELFNATEQELDLAGWTLTKQQKDKGVIEIVDWEEGGIIATGGYYLIEKNEEATTVAANKVSSSAQLMNAGELITLRDAADNVVDQANQLDVWYAGTNNDNGVAMERTIANSDGLLAESWHTSTGEAGGRQGTPGQVNSRPHVNEAPVATISGPEEGLVGEQLVFTAEDTTDLEDDDLLYEWTMGDGTTLSGAKIAYSYKQAGKFEVRVVVFDGTETDAENLEVVITEPKYSDEIIINEFLPDPTGADSEGEFIELKNTGSEAADLAGWQLDDSEGGSKPYTIPSGVSMAAGEIKVFMRTETKIALNNSDDAVRLMDPAGSIKKERGYETSEEGCSFNWNQEHDYLVSTTPTPGSENKISVPAEEEGGEEEEEGEAAQETKQGLVAGTKISKIALSDIRQEEKGALVEVTGTVSVPPGILGERVLYLAGSGVQVYFSKASWPKLSLGDTVKVIGEVSAIGGEARIKLNQQSDLLVTGQGEVPEPHRVETGEVGEETEGWLVMTQGQVTETNGDTFYVDDGSGEIRVYIKSSTKIDKPEMKKGTTVTITGVVSETSSGYRILPRWQEDVRLGLVAGMTSFPATGGMDSWLVVMCGFVWLLLKLARRAGEPLMSR